VTFKHAALEQSAWGRQRRRCSLPVSSATHMQHWTGRQERYSPHGPHAWVPASACRPLSNAMIESLKFEDWIRLETVVNVAVYYYYCTTLRKMSGLKTKLFWMYMYSQTPLQLQFIVSLIRHSVILSACSLRRCVRWQCPSTNIFSESCPV